MQLPLTLILTTISLLPSSLATEPNTPWEKADLMAQVLINQYWTPSTGLFGNLYWNSAAALTTLADHHAYRPSNTTPTVPSLLSTSFAAARNQQNAQNFLNGFYDDEGWWALTWIAAYDITRNATYLQQAASIWDDMHRGWFNGTGSCGGGIWWDKKHTGLGTIENELLLSVSAHLANRVPENKTMYLDWADATWTWFSHSGLLNTSAAGGLVIDAYDVKTCKAGTNKFTYSQGVLIGALLELDVATAGTRPEYLGNATAIADATVAAPLFNNVSTGVFQEPVGGWSNDTMQFKGVFMRNLNLLQRRAPKQAYVDFAERNGESVWEKRWSNGQLGPKWDEANGGQAPYSSSHSSGLAALVARAAMEGGSEVPDVVTKRAARVGVHKRW